MIRREFLRLTALVAAGLAILRGPSLAASPDRAHRFVPAGRHWLAGSPRTGCAHWPGADLTPL